MQRCAIESPKWFLRKNRDGLKRLFGDIVRANSDTRAHVAVWPREQWMERLENEEHNRYCCVGIWSDHYDFRQERPPRAVLSIGFADMEATGGVRTLRIEYTYFSEMTEVVRSSLGGLVNLLNDPEGFARALSDASQPKCGGLNGMKRTKVET